MENRSDFFDETYAVSDVNICFKVSQFFRCVLRKLKTSGGTDGWMKDFREVVSLYDLEVELYPPLLSELHSTYPIGSMYGIFTYIWLFLLW